MISNNVMRAVETNLGRVEARTGETVAKEAAETMSRMSMDVLKLDNVAYLNAFKAGMASMPEDFGKTLEGKWTGEKLLRAMDAHSRGLTNEANATLFNAAYYGLDKHHSALVKTVADELGYKDASTFAQYSLLRNTARDPKWLPELAEQPTLFDKVSFFDKMEKRTAKVEGNKNLLFNILTLPVTLPKMIGLYRAEGGRFF